MENIQETKKQCEKKNKLPLIIVIIIILLLFAIGTVVALTVINKNYDPDIVILNLINENVKSDADNSYKGYTNAKNVGYVLNILTLSKESRVILWDSKNDCYALYDGEELIYSPAEKPSSGTDMWIFVNDIPSSSKFSVYWCGTNTVTTQETEEDGTVVNKNHYYSNHQYAVTAKDNSQTYTCTEEGCGYSYTVKVTK